MCADSACFEMQVLFKHNESHRAAADIYCMLHQTPNSHDRSMNAHTGCNVMQGLQDMGCRRVCCRVQSVFGHQDSNESGSSRGHTECHPGQQTRDMSHQRRWPPLSPFQSGNRVLASPRQHHLAYLQRPNTWKLAESMQGDDSHCCAQQVLTSAGQ